MRNLYTSYQLKIKITGFLKYKIFYKCLLHLGKIISA